MNHCCIDRAIATESSRLISIVISISLQLDPDNSNSDNSKSPLFEVIFIPLGVSYY